MQVNPTPKITDDQAAEAARLLAEADAALDRYREYLTGLGVFRSAVADVTAFTELQTTNDLNCSPQAAMAHLIREHADTVGGTEYDWQAETDFFRGLFERYGFLADEDTPPFITDPDLAEYRRAVAEILAERGMEATADLVAGWTADEAAAYRQFYPDPAAAADEVDYGAPGHDDDPPLDW